MVSKNLIWAAAAFGLSQAANNNNNQGTATSGNGASLAVDPKVIQSGSFFDGSNGLGAEATQAKSATSQNNFVDFCSGQTLTNGLQIVGGSCNSIPMGKIPAKTAMVSSIITFPQEGQKLTAGKEFNISVQTSNLVAGSFTNADTTYYAAPQDLSGGKVIGHTHVTVQDLGNSMNPTTPPDPTQFAFFKGINDAGNGKGLLQATVAGGLPAGNYRLCTLTSSSNHQPVLMPVAQRGSADDCTKFVVTGNGGTANAASNNGSGGQAAAALAASAVADGPGAITTAAAGKGAAATTAAAAKGNNNNNNAGAKAAGNAGASKAGAAAAQATGNAGAKAQGKGKGQQRRSLNFSRRTFVA